MYGDSDLSTALFLKVKSHIFNGAIMDSHNIIDHEIMFLNLSKKPPIF